MSNLTQTPTRFIKDETGCQSYEPGHKNSYSYVPSLEAGIVFLVLFAISMFLHLAQLGWKRREWWCLVFVLGNLTEIIGWGGRTWSSVCPYNKNAFLMQISTLIIAPTFFTAGIYAILKRLIDVFGRKYSPISPSLYLYIFITCDIVSLVIQAVGGGMASSASSNKKDTAPGTNTMVAGIIFQMASISVFVVFFIVFLYRIRRLNMSRSLKSLVFATVISVIVIFIRSIYRTIELLEGWDGYLITTEEYFIVLDGVMMVIAVGVFNAFHPAWLLPEKNSNEERELTSA